METESVTPRLNTVDINTNEKGEIETRGAPQPPIGLREAIITETTNMNTNAEATPMTRT